VTNWREYDAALMRRGSLTLRLTEEAVEAMAGAGDRRAGRSADLFGDSHSRPVSRFALVFHQPLRQTEGPAATGRQCAPLWPTAILKLRSSFRRMRRRFRMRLRRTGAPTPRMWWVDANGKAANSSHVEAAPF
jgi:hypothetical protein